MLRSIEECSNKTRNREERERERLIIRANKHCLVWRETTIKRETCGKINIKRERERERDKERENKKQI